MTGSDLSALFKKHPLGALGFLVCVICGVAIYLRGSAISEAQAQFEEKDTESQKISANVRNMAGLQEQTEELKSASKSLEGRLIRGTNLANNLQIFYRLEADTGVKFLDLRQNPIPPARPGTTKGAYIGVPFSISVQGTYQQVMTFIRRLENGQQLCRFNSISFNKSIAAGVGPDAITANMSIEILGTP